jgi:hypothetical protein
MSPDFWLGRVGIWGWSWGRHVSRFSGLETKRNVWVIAGDDDDNRE